MVLDKTGRQHEQALHGLPAQALHPFRVQRLPQSILEEVDDVGLEERAVAAEEGGDGLHPLPRLLRRLARARPAAAARR